METTTLARPLPIRHKNEPCCAPAVPPRLSTAQTEALAARLKALADPTRLRMRLKLLRQAGLIACERRGIWAYYWATDAGRTSLAALTALA
jgi:DNA-binding transcriptional ArsR family regulator